MVSPSRFEGYRLQVVSAFVDNDTLEGGFRSFLSDVLFGDDDDEETVGSNDSRCLSSIPTCRAEMVRLSSLSALAVFMEPSGPWSSRSIMSAWHQRFNRVIMELAGLLQCSGFCVVGVVVCLEFSCSSDTLFSRCAKSVLWRRVSAARCEGLLYVLGEPAARYVSVELHIQT